MSLNKALERMETKRLQLSAPYLFSGYYPSYSLTVAGCLLLVSTALAVGTSADATHASAPLMFHSFTAFCAVSVLVLMACALCYRVCGGGYAFSSKNVDRQVDWCYQVLLKENAQRIIPWLANCSRAERVCVVAAIAVLGEMGKLLPFWSFTACASAVWIVYLVLRVFFWH